MIPPLLRHPATEPHHRSTYEARPSAGLRAFRVNEIDALRVVATRGDIRTTKTPSPFEIRAGVRPMNSASAHAGHPCWSGSATMDDRPEAPNSGGEVVHVDHPAKPTEGCVAESARSVRSPRSTRHPAELVRDARVVAVGSSTVHAGWTAGQGLAVEQRPAGASFAAPGFHRAGAYRPSRQYQGLTGAGFVLARGCEDLGWSTWTTFRQAVDQGGGHGKQLAIMGTSSARGAAPTKGWSTWTTPCSALQAIGRRGARAAFTLNWKVPEGASSDRWSTWTTPAWSVAAARPRRPMRAAAWVLLPLAVGASTQWSMWTTLLHSSPPNRWPDTYLAAPRGEMAHAPARTGRWSTWTTRRSLALEGGAQPHDASSRRSGDTALCAFSLQVVHVDHLVSHMAGRRPECRAPGRRTLRYADRRGVCGWVVHVDHLAEPAGLPKACAATSHDESGRDPSPPSSTRATGPRGPPDPGGRRHDVAVAARPQLAYPRNEKTP